MSVTVEALRKTFSGTIILPSDAEYETVRNTLFATGSPAVVVQPKNAQEVAAAITFARKHKLALAVRSGGHSGVGFGTNNGGMVIDLSAMNNVEVLDAKKHLVRLGSGATWGDAAHALQKQGLAISSGDTRTVGVGGLTLGGGIGWMVRKYGLTIDAVVAMELVTADGQVLRVTEHDHPDLFWALRGGAGNFGIVTTFEFKAHPIGKVHFGVIQYGLDDMEHILKGWRDCMRAASDDLTTMFTVLPEGFGPMPGGIMLMCCYAGEDDTAAQKALDPLLRLGTPVANTITKKDYADVLEEAHVPQGVKVVTKDTFIKEFTDEAVATIANLYHDGKGPILQIRGLGGALQRVANDATAFSHRDNEVLVVSPVFVAPDASDEVIAKALEPWQKIAAFGNGAYGNLITTNSPEDVAAIYPTATYERLQKIKQQVDPYNIFNSTYNVH